METEDEDDDHNNHKARMGKWMGMMEVSGEYDYGDSDDGTENKDNAAERDNENEDNNDGSLVAVMVMAGMIEGVIDVVMLLVHNNGSANDDDSGDEC